MVFRARRARRLDDSSELPWTLPSAGFSPWPGYSCEPTQPWDVARVWSSAIWGGIWGHRAHVPLVRLQVGGRYCWPLALAVGAFLATGVGALLMAFPYAFTLKGKSPADAVATALIVNAAWGAASALLTRLLIGTNDRSHDSP
jgi:hypothetical protein